MFIHLLFGTKYVLKRPWIKFIIMAKQIDYSKIENIRKATIAVISRNGVINSSVATIAKEAGVSVGYLYRHYQSKEELLDDILLESLSVINDQIDEQLNENKSIKNVIASVVKYVIESGLKDKDKLRFTLTLLNDFSVIINNDIKKRIEAIGDRILDQGRKNGELKPELTHEDLYIAMIGLPLQYVSVRNKFGFSNYLKDNKALVNRIIEISINMCIDNKIQK